MHLVFLNQYYPPDAAPTGVMLESVVEELASQGHEVTVICSVGGYAETRQKTSRQKTEDEEAHVGASCESSVFKSSVFSLIPIPASRFGRGTFAGKVADYLCYYLGTAWRLMWLHPRPDRIIALTTPPYLSVLARFSSKLRGGDHAHWVMDLYPDVMVAHGMLHEGGVAHRALAALACWGFGGRRCAGLLTLGPDMAERIDMLLKPRRERVKTSWIPLWSGTEVDRKPDDAVVEKRRLDMGWTDNELVVMYSGNMGLGHRFGEILEVAAAMRTRGKATAFRFVFFGGGKRRGEIEGFAATHPELAVELHDYAPSNMLPVHLRSADVHLASLAPEWSGTMVPSKLQGIFHVGRPVIFIGDMKSSIGRWVVESGGGWVVKPGDPSALARALDEARDPAARELRGAAAKAFAETHFHRVGNTRKVAARFVPIAGGSCSRPA